MLVVLANSLNADVMLDAHHAQAAMRGNPGYVIASTGAPIAGREPYRRLEDYGVSASPMMMDPQPITLHECLHTYASMMIAAGVNLKALQTFMGHSSITITLDRYGHLRPGAEDEAATLLDAYLAAA